LFPLKESGDEERITMDIVAENAAVKVHASIPEGWFFARKAVPKLVVPRELFVAATSELKATPSETSQPRPWVQTLTASDMVVWCYHQRPEDPDPLDPLAVPDYSRFTLPLAYSESEVFPSTDAREWSPAVFLWRRIGFPLGSARVSVWIWEGTRAQNEALQATERLLASVSAA
jgi:hypothetical protein